MMVIDGCEIFDQNKIAHSFNKFFLSIGPKLASSIPSSSKDFKDFLSPVSTNLDEYPLHDEELNEAFNSLRLTKVQVLMIFHQQLLNAVMKTYLIQLNMFLASH